MAGMNFQTRPADGEPESKRDGKKKESNKENTMYKIN